LKVYFLFFFLLFGLILVQPAVLADPPEYFVLKASFHTHTTYSDGFYSPQDVVEMYHDAGYDCIAITDHNTTAGISEAKTTGSSYDMIIIGGEEVSYFFPDGTPMHIVALFINNTINPGTYNVSWYFEQIHLQNGLGEVAHPWVYTPEWDITFNWTETKWFPYWNESYIDGFELSKYWSNATFNMILDNGNFVTFNHDFHSGTIPTTYYTLVFATEKSEAGIKEALLQQRVVCISGSKAWGTSEALALYQSIVIPEFQLLSKIIFFMITLFLTGILQNFLKDRQEKIKNSK
jgi:hypothetical protein